LLDEVHALMNKLKSVKRPSSVGAPVTLNSPQSEAAKAVLEPREYLVYPIKVQHVFIVHWGFWLHYAASPEQYESALQEMQGDMTRLAKELADTHNAYRRKIENISSENVSLREQLVGSEFRQNRFAALRLVLVYWQL
jgi:ABC-type long-subunit fatty acid transport system fused permease/ATPase subunit